MEDFEVNVENVEEETLNNSEEFNNNLEMTLSELSSDIQDEKIQETQKAIDNIRTNIRNIEVKIITDATASGSNAGNIGIAIDALGTKFDTWVKENPNPTPEDFKVLDDDLQKNYGKASDRIRKVGEWSQEKVGNYFKKKLGYKVDWEAIRNFKDTYKEGEYNDYEDLNNAIDKLADDHNTEQNKNAKNKGEGENSKSKMDMFQKLFLLGLAGVSIWEILHHIAAKDSGCYQMTTGVGASKICCNGFKKRYSNSQYLCSCSSKNKTTFTGEPSCSVTDGDKYPWQVCPNTELCSEQITKIGAISYKYQEYNTLTVLANTVENAAKGVFKLSGFDKVFDMFKNFGKYMVIGILVIIGIVIISTLIKFIVNITKA